MIVDEANGSMSLTLYIIDYFGGMGRHRQNKQRLLFLKGLIDIRGLPYMISAVSGGEVPHAKSR